MILTPDDRPTAIGVDVVELADPAHGQPRLQVICSKNIAFDGNGNPISVSNALLDVCLPGTYGGKVFACPGDINELLGTGFEEHGATSWLQTNAPVTPGSVATLTFGAYDSGDGVLDSTVLLDDFQWSAKPAQTGTDDACDSGGSRRCNVCVIDAIGPEGCCDEAWTACQASAPCSSLSSCVPLCGNQVCVDGCRANYPGGVALYEDTLDCLYGQSRASVGGGGADWFVTELSIGRYSSGATRMRTAK